MDARHTMGTGISPLRGSVYHLNVIQRAYIGAFPTSYTLIRCVKPRLADNEVVEKWIGSQTHELSGKGDPGLGQWRFPPYERNQFRQLGFR